MDIRPMHWAGALLISATLHLGAAYVIYTPATGATAPGGTGVTVELGTAVALAETVAPPLDAEPDQPSPTPVAMESAVDATKIGATAGIEVESESKLSNSKPQFESIQETPAVEIKAEAVGIESVLTVGVPPNVANIVSNPEPNQIEVNEVRTDSRPVPAAVEARTEAIALTNLSAPKYTGDTVSDRPSNPDDVASAAGNFDRGGGPGNNSVVAQNYYAELSTWLSRHKHYPRHARRKRQQGIVEVEFIIDGNGQLLDYRIVTSSGFRLLDNEAQALLERAAPMPSIPAELKQTRLSIIAPISFSLR
jgi:protein TonB